MSLEDVVTVNITRRTTAVERAGFGTLLHLAMHRAWEDRIRTYEEASDLLDDGFAVTDPAYGGALAYFAQTPKPERIKIGRLATADTVTVKIDTVANSTRYTVFIDGVGFDFNSDATATSAEIEAGLVSILNAGYPITAVSIVLDKFTIAGNHVTSFPAGAQFRVDGSTGNDGDYTIVRARLVSGSTEIEVEEDVMSAVVDGAVVSLTDVAAQDVTPGDGMITVDPDTASDFFAIKASSNMHVEYTLDGTIAENLNDIEFVESLTWYGTTLARQYGALNKDRQRDLADEIEARRKLAGFASDDSDIVDTSVSEDDPDTGTIARQLQAASYARSWALFSEEATGDLEDTFPDCAWFGARFTTDPGRETWKFASLAGITADDLTATQRLNALAKNANVYVPVTTDISITEEGTVGEGEFIDVIRFIDFLQSEITADVFSALINPPAPMTKVPFTDAGIAVVDNALRGALQRNTTEGGDVRGLASYTTTVPDVADVSTADKAARLLRNVDFAGVLSGAIHATDIDGTVSV